MIVVISRYHHFFLYIKERMPLLYPSLWLGQAMHGMPDSLFDTHWTLGYLMYGCKVQALKYHWVPPTVRNLVGKEGNIIPRGCYIQLWCTTLHLTVLTAKISMTSEKHQRAATATRTRGAEVGTCKETCISTCHSVVPSYYSSSLGTRVSARHGAEEGGKQWTWQLD